MEQLKHVIEVWTGYAQGLTGSIGALAFVCAFIWMRADDRDAWTNSCSSLNRASDLWPALEALSTARRALARMRGVNLPCNLLSRRHRPSCRGPADSNQLRRPARIRHRYEPD